MWSRLAGQLTTLADGVSYRKQFWLARWLQLTWNPNAPIMTLTTERFMYYFDCLNEVTSCPPPPRVCGCVGYIELTKEMPRASPRCIFSCWVSLAYWGEERRTQDINNTVLCSQLHSSLWKHSTILYIAITLPDFFLHLLFACEGTRKRARDTAIVYMLSYGMAEISWLSLRLGLE